MNIYRTTFRLLFIVIIGANFYACENPATLDQGQIISEVSWKPDGSGILSLIQRYNASPTVSSPIEGYDLYRIGGDGSLGDPYSAPAKAISDFSFAIFQSQDGKRATLQLGNNVYRIDLNSGAATQLVGSYHLIAMSPDEKYLIGSHSPAGQPIKTISIYDVSATPARLVKGFDIHVANSRGVFFADNTFGITVIDSIGTNITIFDTMGTARDTIADAATISHNFVYHPTTGSLFFRNGANNIVKVNMTTFSRQTIVPASVTNFDITADENFIIYNQYQGSKLQMVKREVASGNESLLTDDILWGVFLSPNDDKVAYIRAANVNFHEIKVMPFVR